VWPKAHTNICPIVRILKNSSVGVARRGSRGPAIILGHCHSSELLRIMRNNRQPINMITPTAKSRNSAQGKPRYIYPRDCRPIQIQFLNSTAPKGNHFILIKNLPFIGKLLITARRELSAHGRPKTPQDLIRTSTATKAPHHP
jgi:hypothetical protein